MAIDLSEKKLLKEVGAKIRAIRMAKGWTLEEAEEHGWPSWRHLQLIESGKKNIALTTLIRLARVFKVKPTDLLKDL